MTLKDTLHFLQSTAGVNFLIGIAWAYLIEMIPGLKVRYEKLAPRRKRLVIALFSLGVPFLAFAGKLVLGYEYISIDVIWQVAVAWGMGFFGSQLAHMFPNHPERLGKKFD